MKTNISPLTGFGSLPAFRNTFQCYGGTTMSQLRGVEEVDDEKIENYEDHLNKMRDTCMGDTKMKKEMFKRKTLWD